MSNDYLSSEQPFAEQPGVVYPDMSKEESYKAAYDKLWNYTTSIIGLLAPEISVTPKPDWDKLPEEIRQIWRNVFDADERITQALRAK